MQSLVEVGLIQPFLAGLVKEGRREREREKGRERERERRRER